MDSEEQFETYRPLLAGLLDGELSAEETVKVNDALTRSEKLREEYNRLCAMDEELKHLSTIEPTEEIARRLWASPYHRVARDVGVWLIVGGYVLLIAYSLFHLATSDAPALPSIAVFAIIGGIITLLVTLIRERVATHKSDPYKDIEK